MALALAAASRHGQLGSQLAFVPPPVMAVGKPNYAKRTNAAAAQHAGKNAAAADGSSPYGKAGMSSPFGGGSQVSLAPRPPGGSKPKKASGRQLTARLKAEAAPMAMAVGTPRGPDARMASTKSGFRGWQTDGDEDAAAAARSGMSPRHKSGAKRMNQAPAAAPRAQRSKSHRHVNRGPSADWHDHHDGGSSHWRDCHFADALSPSLLKHLLKVEGGAAE